VKLPPLVARLHVRTRARSLDVWVPLFLVWLLVLVPAAPLLLVAVLAALAFAPRWNVARLAWAAYVALCASRGTVVGVERDRTRVLVTLR
jgi:uncharacterized membrane protein